MKKTMQKVFVALLFIATITGQMDGLAGRRSKKIAEESPATLVNKEVSILDQIVEQARMIISAVGSTANTIRSKAKSELTRLMKELDAATRDAINEYVTIIKNSTEKNKAEAKKAYDQLIAVINAMDAEAKVISAIEEGRIAIELAPAAMKPQVIAEQVQNVQAAEAQAEQAGLVSRIVGGVKGALAAPGNYFFPGERTAAKTAFEVTVGLAVTAGTAFVAYKLAPEGTAAQFTNLYERGKAALGFGKEVAVEEPVAAESTIINSPVSKEYSSEFTQIGERVGKEVGKKIGEFDKQYQQRSIEALENAAEPFEDESGSNLPLPKSVREASKKAGQAVGGVGTWLFNAAGQAQQALSPAGLAKEQERVRNKQEEEANARFLAAQREREEQKERQNALGNAEHPRQQVPEAQSPVQTSERQEGDQGQQEAVMPTEQVEQAEEVVGGEPEATNTGVAENQE